MMVIEYFGTIRYTVGLGRCTLYIQYGMVVDKIALIEAGIYSTWKVDFFVSTCTRAKAIAALKENDGD